MAAAKEGSKEEKTIPENELATPSPLYRSLDGRTCDECDATNAMQLRCKRVDVDESDESIDESIDESNAMHRRRMDGNRFGNGAAPRRSG